MNQEIEVLKRKIGKLKIQEMPNTFLEIIGKSKDEVIISSIIAFLLNPENTTNKIIELLLEKTKSEKEKNDFVELLNKEDNTFISVKTEEWISKRSRVDIIIKFSLFWIVIENKVDSGENNNQLLRYVEDLKNVDVPIKYICLKPNYNKYEFKNDNFVKINYSELIQILKQISIYNFKKKENYIYMEELIKHAEVYLMKENEIEIGEDVEFYIENKEKLETIANNYKKQCNIVTEKLESKIKEKFGDNYEVYVSPSMKWQFIQVWKNNWDNENHNGIHYEIWGEINQLLNTETQIVFTIHNEIKTKNKYINIPPKQDLKINKYKFDTSENIENSINLIAEELFNISRENDARIDEEINRVNNL